MNKIYMFDTNQIKTNYRNLTLPQLQVFKQAPPQDRA